MNMTMGVGKGGGGTKLKIPKWFLAMCSFICNKLSYFLSHNIPNILSYFMKKLGTYEYN